MEESQFDLYGETNSSLADSSVYNQIVDDMSAVNAFIDTAREQKQVMEQSLGGKTLGSQFKSKLSVGGAEDPQKLLKSMQNEFKDLQERREDPDAHFKKLKAKIKLKVVKQYQEDLEQKKEDSLRAAQPVVVIKDKHGRVMQL